MKTSGLLAICMALAALAIAGCGDSKDDSSDKATTVKTAGADPEAEASSDWSYSGATGPSHWGQLNPDYAECSKGREQSPIDLTQVKKASLAPIEVSYKNSVTVDQENNGHSIEAAVPKGNTVTIGGKTYELAQFHSHAPSEHEVNGKHFPMEVHFVHPGDDGAAAAVTVFAKQGTKNNSAWAKLLSGMPAKKGEHRDVEGVDLAKLVAPNNGASPRYSYNGGLTTPPCTEGVQFNIYKQPISLSATQIKAFKKLYDHNIRPLQPRNGRTIKVDQ